MFYGGGGIKGLALFWHGVGTRNNPTLLCWVESIDEVHGDSFSFHEDDSNEWREDESVFYEAFWYSGWRIAFVV